MKKTDNLFIVDTNTLISAFISPNSTAQKALNKAIQTGYVVQSRSIAEEFAEVFIRPKFDKYLPLDERIEAIDKFTALVLLMEPTISVVASRDHKDDQFLELAVGVNAACIITGDKDLLVLNPFKNIPIITAGDFLMM
jgi:putative PIN family toxin of toxin-antitoxin system